MQENVEEGDSTSSRLFLSPSLSDSADTCYQRGKWYRDQVDSLWQIFDQQPANAPMLSPADSARFSKLWNKGVEILKRGPEPSPQLSYPQREQLIHDYEKARDYFYQAASLNPFHRDAREALARTLEGLARLHELNEDLLAANNVLESIIAANPSRFLPLYYLGVNHLELQEYSKALKYFIIAEDVAIHEACFDVAMRSEAPDYPALGLNETWKNNLYGVLVGRLRCEEALGLTENARCTIRRILEIAPVGDREDYQKEIENFRRFGNIANWREVSEFRKLREEGRYEEAQSFGLGLIEMLRGTQGFDEIVTEVALVKFNDLKEREEGHTLLKSIVAGIRNRNAGYEENSKILNAYGSMCYTLGLDNESIDPQRASEYHTEGSNFEWQYTSNGTRFRGRGLCYYRLAVLSEADAKSCAEYARSALNAEITPEYRQDVRQLLVGSLRKLYRFPEADEVFREMVRESQEGTHE